MPHSPCACKLAPSAVLTHPLLSNSPQVRPLKPPEDPLSATQIYVVVVSLATVALWCCNNLVAHVTGEMGVLAILPLGAHGLGAGAGRRGA